MKGSSFFIWFLVGAALPGIGIIAAVLYRYEQDDPLRQCPECGNVVPISDQVCMSCGADLSFPDGASYTGSPCWPARLAPQIPEGKRRTALARRHHGVP